jgi:hypothetical protein
MNIFKDSSKFKLVTLVSYKHSKLMNYEIMR